ncbi:MAG: hypothetical protein M1835_003181, partial [Candelina submexicana]
MSDLLQNPPDLAFMRQRLFEPREEVVLSVEGWDTYWDYVTNGLQTFYYCCRLYPKEDGKAQGT